MKLSHETIFTSIGSIFIMWPSRPGFNKTPRFQVYMFLLSRWDGRVVRPFDLYNENSNIGISITPWSREIFKTRNTGQELSAFTNYILAYTITEYTPQFLIKSESFTSYTRFLLHIPSCKPSASLVQRLCFMPITYSTCAMNFGAVKCLIS